MSIHVPSYGSCNFHEDDIIILKKCSMKRPLNSCHNLGLFIVNKKTVCFQRAKPNVS